MTSAIDRTGELEQRLRAISVSSGDTCVFFHRRDDCPFPQRQCAYCMYACFNSDDPQARGLCKFKK